MGCFWKWNGFVDRNVKELCHERETRKRGYSKTRTGPRIRSRGRRGKRTRGNEENTKRRQATGVTSERRFRWWGEKVGTGKGWAQRWVWCPLVGIFYSEHEKWSYYQVSAKWRRSAEDCVQFDKGYVETDGRTGLKDEVALGTGQNCHWKRLPHTPSPLTSF